MKNRLILAILLFAGGLQAQNFAEVAASLNVNGTYGANNLGGGISFCDFDGDGDDDLTCASDTMELIYFYRNDGGTFTEISAPVPHSGNSMQILWADIDNDGDKDLFVCDYTSRNYLYRNDGGMNFTDISVSAGLNMVATQTWGATFGDYDNDGYLDLYVCNRGILGNDNYMYHNNGDGTFSDVSAATNTQIGIIDPVFCAIFFDYNEDGWQDLYIAVDRTGYPNRLLKNNGDGTFSDESTSSGTNCVINAMNSSGGDYDNDGDLDLYVTNTPEGNAFFRNNGDGTFADVAATNGTIFYRVGWGANFFDYDNDLDLDLYVSCMQDKGDKPNAFYVNDGAGNFTEPLFNSSGLGGKDTLQSIVNTIGDFNDDGNLDIIVGGYQAQPFMFWQNNEANSNNYLKVNVEGTVSNRDGIGAIVEMYIGANKYMRVKHCGEGYLGQTSGKLHFGMGTATQADSLIVRWVGGNIDKWTNVQANTIFNAVELSAPLPLQLLSFAGDKSRADEISIAWKSTEEVNLMGYELQRSTSGLQYEIAHYAEAKGGVGRETVYSYVDKNLMSGRRYYYRLKMIDLDGKFTYSKVISFEIPADITINRIFPNPVVDQVNIEYSLDKKQAATLRIIDAAGTVVHRSHVNLIAGTDIVNVAVDQLAPGNYWIKLDGRFEAEEMQFVIPKK